MGNRARDFVAIIGCMVEFEIGDGSRGTADVLAVHAEDEGDERAREGKGREDIAPLIVKRRIVERDKADVIGAGLKSNVSESVRIEICGVTCEGEAAIYHCIYPF